MAFKVLRAGLIGAALASALAVGMMSAAEARDEGGTWPAHGAGVVRLFMPQGNARERIAAHSYSGGGGSVMMSGNCATPSGSVFQSARLRRVGANSYAGSFFNQPIQHLWQHLRHGSRQYPEREPPKQRGIRKPDVKALGASSKYPARRVQRTRRAPE